MHLQRLRDKSQPRSSRVRLANGFLEDHLDIARRRLMDFESKRRPGGRATPPSRLSADELERGAGQCWICREKTRGTSAPPHPKTQGFASPQIRRLTRQRRAKSSEGQIG